VAVAKTAGVVRVSIGRPPFGSPFLWVTYWVTYETGGSLEKDCKLMIVLGLDWSALEDDFRTLLIAS
jgi:hypothetical protein